MVQQRGGEGVASADRIGHRDADAGLFGDAGRAVAVRSAGQQAAAVAAGQAGHPESVASEQIAQHGRFIAGRHAERGRHPRQFVVVQLHRRGRLQRSVQQVGGPEVLAQVDVEQAHAVRRAGFDERPDDRGRGGPALRQGAERDRVGARGQLPPAAVEARKVERHRLVDGVARRTGAQRHLHGAGRVLGIALQTAPVHAQLAQAGNQVVAGGVTADAARQHAAVAEQRGVVDQIRHRPAEFAAAVGEHVPQQFTDAHDHKRAAQWRSLRSHHHCYRPFC